MMLADFDKAHVLSGGGGVATLAYMVERANVEKHTRNVPGYHYHRGEQFWLENICDLLRTRKVKCSQWLMSSLKKPEHKQAIVKAIILMQAGVTDG